MGNAVSKIIEDVNCSVEIALCWAINAKNSLQNIHGFSPYQLVFGKNPNLPSVLTNRLPALEGVTSSQLIADNLNALHKARQEFIKSESCDKLRRALRSKTRTHSNVQYIQGDKVYYKREDEKRWKGPGTVIGQTGSVVLIKVPTGYVSVHSSRVVLTCDTTGDQTREENLIENNIEHPYDNIVGDGKTHVLGNKDDPTAAQQDQGAIENGPSEIQEPPNVNNN